MELCLVHEGSLDVGVCGCMHSFMVHIGAGVWGLVGGRGGRGNWKMGELHDTRSSGISRALFLFLHLYVLSLSRCLVLLSAVCISVEEMMGEDDGGWGSREEGRERLGRGALIPCFHFSFSFALTIKQDVGRGGHS